MDRYAEVWERFEKERRLEFGGHTDPSWRDGHAISASFIVPVDAGKLRERLEPLRDALRRFPFVTLHPDRFLHITLLFLGFLAEEPEGPEEISRERLHEIEAEARAALRGFPAFPMRLANLNAFPGAVFVEAHDGGMLGRLREAVCHRCGLDTPSGPPHLTLGYVHAPDGSPAPEEFVETLRRYRDWPVGEMQVDGVQVTLLDLGREYPSPDPIASIPLDG